MRFLLTAAFLLLSLIQTAQAQSELSTRLFIVSPAPGEVIFGNKVNVEIALPDDNIGGEGDVYIWIDAGLDYNKETAVVLDETLKYTYTDVYPGLHTIYAEYIGDDENAIYTHKTSVDFETIEQELKPAPVGDSGTPATPEPVGGLFLPSGGGNTILAIVLAVFAIIILWYLFGKKRKK